MKLTTEVSFPDFSPKLTYADRLVFAGSCFAGEIGGRMERMQFRTAVNPAGITYNPCAAALLISSALSGKTYLPEDFLYAAGRYVHPDFHSALSGADPDAAAARTNAALREYETQLRAADVLFLTLGTAVVFSRVDTEQPVNNCHKLPADLFRQSLPDEDYFSAHLTKALKELRRVNPKVKICLTVSPVRHTRHGAVLNQRSKARLIRLCEMICDRSENSVYLPIYEFVNDELRDYRFYRQDDLIHLNEAGINLIFERFKAAAIAPEASVLMPKVERLLRMNGHRVVLTDSAEAEKFAAKKERLSKEIEAALGRELRFGSF